LPDKKKTPVTAAQWKVLISLMLGIFMAALDISIVSPAIPVIIKELSITERQIPWIITLYLLVYVVSIPLMAALSDRFGRKRIILLDVAIFASGSLWAALSPNFLHLLVARAIQALGAGGIFPIATTVIGETFPKDRQGMALGFNGVVWGIAAILGPPVGGWLTQWLGWTSIFYLNLPIAVFILFYGVRNLPRDSGVHEHPLDVQGMVFLGVGLTTLTYGLNQLNSNDLLGSLILSGIWPWIVAGLFLLTIFLQLEKRPKAPVVSPVLFKKHQLDIGLYLSFAGGIAEAGLVFLPLYAVRALSIKTGAAGSLMAAGALTLVLFTEPMGILVDRAGARFVLLIGTFFTALGAFLFTTAHNLLGFIGFQIIIGVGLSALLGAPVRYVALAETNDMERASAQSLVSLVSSFGIMIGTTLAGAFMASNTGTLEGFHEIYLTVAIAAAIGFILSFWLKSPKQTKQTSHKHRKAIQKK
jgi:EmrB/QacA subfamily drug resistance transporter